jgi:hypothetical protein
VNEQEFMESASATVARGPVTWEQLHTLQTFDELQIRVLASILDTGWHGTVGELAEAVELLAGPR